MTEEMLPEKNLISVVIPVYKAEQIIGELCSRLVRALEAISNKFEIILVEDCGNDNSWEKILEVAHNDSRIKGLALSRNFGQHHAITAGIDCVDAEWVVVMDCDLQDQPEEISKLYSKAKEGYDCVLARREFRQDSIFKKITSAIFYRLLKYLSDIDHDSSVASFGIYSMKFVNSIRLFREQFRSFGMFANMAGFKRIAIPVEHSARPSGKSSYTFRKRLKLAIDSMVAFSNKPLVLSIEFGFMGASLSILFIIYLVLRYFSTGIPVSGWTSTIASIYLVGSVLLMNLGFIGLYLGRVFDEVKNRPLYIIGESVNLSFDQTNNYNAASKRLER